MGSRVSKKGETAADKKCKRITKKRHKGLKCGVRAAGCGMTSRGPKYNI